MYVPGLDVKLESGLAREEGGHVVVDLLVLLELARKRRQVHVVRLPELQCWGAGWVKVSDIHHQNTHQSEAE